MKYFCKNKKWKTFLSKYEAHRAERRVAEVEKDELELEPKKKKKKKTASKRPLSADEPDESLSAKESQEEGEQAERRKVKAKRRRDRAEEALSEEKAEAEAEAPQRFSDLALSDKTLAGLREMKFEVMTAVQAAVIPNFLQPSWRNVVATARTGSGKTLAYLVPALELVYRIGYKPWTGTGALIITPSRELCLQTFGVLKQLAKHFSFRVGLVMGGTDRQQEAKDLEKGVAILVATPGRLLAHMQSTPHFVYHHVSYLVIDEADRLLDKGFEPQMREIVALLDKADRPRVALLFTATLGRAERQLANKVMQPGMAVNEVSVEVDLPPKLVQSYFIYEPEQRVDLLFRMVKGFAKTKAIIFFNCCLAVDYFHKLVTNMSHLRPIAIHGRMDQSQRLATFFRFCKADTGVMFCTDVAARGLDIPDVNWIVQFDAPIDPLDYVHRVGRTARAGAAGRALLMLRAEERGFVSLLRQRYNVASQRCQPLWADLECQASLVTTAMNQSPLFMKPLAEEAFVSYIRAYSSHPMKEFFDPKALDLKAEGRNFFGFKKAPHVSI